ncbi:MAG: division/cell wall cluster transcriptional repressor MraZ [Actinobacteria bacterium]|nr:division/cell wall cluster transcriptional repressor MraZ [Actinomycetota bacterium]
MAFRGHYDHSLDAKNRLSVPARFRAALSDGLVQCRWLDPCIAIWTPDALTDFTERVVGDLNPISPRARKLLGFFAGGAFEVELDSAGRVTLNQSLLDAAGIEREVTVVGLRDHVEVWDRARWREAQEGVVAEIERIAESLDHPS